MSDRELRAYQDSIPIGTFAQTAAGNTTFTYDDAHRQSRDATPLSLAMPLATARHRK